MRLVTVFAVALAGCGGPGTPSVPVGNQAPVTRTGPVGIPVIDDAAFARLVASGAWDQVIEPDRGVVELSAVSTAVDDAPGEFWVHRRCGSEAAATLDRIGTAIAARAHGELKDDYTTGCESIGTFVECGQAGLGEYDLGYRLRFELRTGGYVVSGVTTIDVGDEPGDLARNYEAEMARPTGC